MPEPDDKPTASLTLKLVLVTASLGLSVLVAEGLLRLVWSNPFAAEEPALLVHIATQPPSTNRTYMGPYGKKRVSFRTDNRGYILPSRSSRADALTVAFLGGSTMELSAVSEDVRFPALAAALLTKDGVPVDALNAGRSGNTTHEALNILLNHAIADRPDVAVMMHAVNDTGVLAHNGNYAHAMAHRNGLRWGLKAVARYLAGTSSLVGLVRFTTLGGATHTTGKRTYDEVRQKAPDQPYRQRVRAFVALARAFGVAPVLMTQPMAYQRDKKTPTWAKPAKQAVFNEIVREVAHDKHVTLIDLDKKVRQIDSWDTPDKLFYDGLHVNDAGSKVFAEIVANGLRQLLNRLRSRSLRFRRESVKPAASSTVTTR